MTKYVVVGNFGFCGTDFCEPLGEFEDIRDAEQYAFDLVCQNAESAGVAFEEDYENPEDAEEAALHGMTLGSRDELDWYVQEYSPEEHDDIM